MVFGIMQFRLATENKQEDRHEFNQALDGNDVGLQSCEHQRMWQYYR